MNFKPVDLGQRTVSQYRKFPGSDSACFYTARFMYFVTVCGLDATWEEYAEACFENGSVRRSDFRIMDPDKMAAAAGHPELKSVGFTENLADKIDALLNDEKPVPFSLSAHHFESIDGRVAINGVPFWTLDDPAGRDTHANCTTLEVGKFVRGVFIPRLRQGERCKITKVYAYVNK